MELNDAVSTRRTVRDFTPRPVSLESARRLLGAGQRRTNADGLRAAPSAHALHPLRLWLVAGSIEELEPGIYAYDVESGSLTSHRKGDCRPAFRQAALENPVWVGEAAGLIVVTAVMDEARREFADQTPDGLRGERYVFMEAGAVAQTIHLQAVEEDLGLVLVAGIDDEATAHVLQADATQSPLALLAFGKAAT